MLMMTQTRFLPEFYMEPQQRKPLIAVIDGDPLIHRSVEIYKHLRVRSSGRPSGIVYGATENLIRVLDRLKPAHFMICWDWGRSRWRKALYDGYKASRDKPATESSRERAFSIDEIKLQKWAVQSLLQLAGVLQLAVDGVEADDLIGMVTSALHKTDTYETVIVSGDRDLHQLVTSRVWVYDPILKKSTTISDIQEAYGVEVSQLRDYAALSGVGGDDIPKIRGIGPVRASLLLREHKTIEELLGHLDGMQDSKCGQALKRGQETLKLARQLVHIPTVDEPSPLTESDLAALRNVLLCPVNKDWFRFAAGCESWEMAHLLRKADVLHACSPPDVSLLQKFFP